MADKYAKIWTSVLYDEWFLGLTAIERGIWLQLIVIAKQFGDNSRIFQRNFPALAAMLGTDRKTLRRVAGKFYEDGKITIAEHKNGAIDITISKYEFYQEVKAPKDKITNNGNVGKIVDKPQKNPTLPDQTRPNQTKPTHSKHPAPPDFEKPDYDKIRQDGIRLATIALVRRFKGGDFDSQTIAPMLWREYSSYNLTADMFRWIVEAKVIPHCTDVRHCLAYVKSIGDEKGAHASEARKFLAVAD